MRLAELAQLRQRVRDLVPKLRRQPAEVDTDAIVPPLELRDYLNKAAGEGDFELPAAPPVVDEAIRQQFDALISMLDDSTPTMDARKVALQPEVFDLGIEPREIIAYRRLYSGSICDRELEEFVLRAAALRMRIEQEVGEIKGILDDTTITRRAPQYVKARETVRMSDLYLREFEHRMETAVLEGDGEEARALQVLKMRIMRGYSGLWLMVCRG